MFIPTTQEEVNQCSARDINELLVKARECQNLSPAEEKAVELINIWLYNKVSAAAKEARRRW